LRRLFNILFRSFLAVCAAGLVVSGVAYFLLRASVPKYEEDFSVEGIEGPVDILRDTSVDTARGYADHAVSENTRRVFALSYRLRSLRLPEPA